MMVRVYWNLHRKMWSVQDAKTRKVIGHAKRIVLDGCDFKVSEKGRQRVIREGKKNVHAFAVGPLHYADWADVRPPMIQYDWNDEASLLANHIGQELRLVGYNPYKRGAFCIVNTDSEVWFSGMTLLTRTAGARMPPPGKAPHFTSIPRVYTTR